MRKYAGRIVLSAGTLLIGLVIGFAWGETSGEGARDAQAAKPKAAEPRKVQRYGSVIGVKRKTLDKYIELHKAVWPGVLQTIKDCNIRNYSIYLGQLDDDNLYLFAYFEYSGDDFRADMKKMAADGTTQKWWKETDPLQIPQKRRKKGEHWMTMREVFHID